MNKAYLKSMNGNISTNQNANNPAIKLSMETKMYPATKEKIKTKLYRTILDLVRQANMIKKEADDIETLKNRARELCEELTGMPQEEFLKNFVPPAGGGEQ